MTDKSNKNTDPTADIRKLRKSVDEMLDGVDRTIKAYDQAKPALSEDAVKKADPMVDALKRDRKIHARRADKILGTVSKLRKIQTADQFHKVHVAGTEMFKTIGKIENATLPMVIEVMEVIEEDTKNA